MKWRRDHPDLKETPTEKKDHIIRNNQDMVVVDDLAMAGIVLK